MTVDRPKLVKLDAAVTNATAVPPTSTAGVPTVGGKGGGLVMQPPPPVVAGRSTARGLDIKNQLLALLEEEPLVDGVSHPAEQTLQRELESGALDAASLRRLCLDVDRPSFSAAALRCLARTGRPENSEWRQALIREGLSAPDPVLRDAAIQAVEEWAEAPLGALLESHRDPLPWLHDYAQEVARDLQE